MSSNRHPEEEEAEYSERPSVPGASQASNADDKTISSKRSKLSLAPAFHSTPALPSGSMVLESRRSQPKTKEGDDKEHQTEPEVDIPQPGAEIVGGPPTSNHPTTESPTSAPAAPAADVENPDSSLIQAEVTQDLDQAITQAVQDALQARETEIVRASQVVVEPSEDDVEGQAMLQEQLAQHSATATSEQDGQDKDRQKKKQMILFGSIGVLVLILIIVLATTLSGGSDDDNAIPAPLSPTEPPTQAGTEWTIPPTINGAFPAEQCRQDSTILLPLSRQESNHTVPLSNFSNLECGIIPGAATNNLLWYTLAPYKDEIVTAHVRAQSMFSYLYVLEGDCDTTQTCLVSSYSSYSNLVLSFPAKVGKTYFILVSTNGKNGGQYQLDIENTELIASGECNAAIEINSRSFSQTMSNEPSFPSFADITCLVSEDDRGVWFHYTPQEDDSIVTASITGHQFNAKLSYYTGVDCSTLICEKSTVASGYSARTVKFHAQMGTDYFFLVAGNGFNAAGNFQFSVEAPKPPTNSYCTGATDVSDDIPFTLTDTTVHAVPAFSNLICSIDPTHRGLWYKHVPEEEDAIVTATLSGQVSSSRLSYYTGNSCEDLTCEQWTSSSTLIRSITFHAKVGTTYYVLVSGNTFDNAGAFQIAIDAPSPPSNSFCSGATSILSGSETTFSTEDTSSFAVPSFASLSCQIAENHRGLWYKYRATSDSITTVHVSAQQFGARVSYYTGFCGSLSCDGFTGSSPNSERTLSFHAKAGVDYYFFVSGNTFNDAGAFNVQVEAPVPPANSYCSGATNVLGGSETAFFVEESSTLAVPSFSSLSCNIQPTHRGLWYKFSPSSNSIVRVGLSGQQASSRLSYYTGSCSTLTCGGESGSSTVARSLMFHGIPGTDYYILVSGFAFDYVGKFRIDIEAPTPPTSSFCSLATAISASALSLGGVSMDGDTTNAVPSYSSLLCSVSASERGTWYKITVDDPLTTSITATMTGQTFVAKLSVFSSSSSTSCDALTCVSKIVASPYSARILTWSASVGITYYVLVSGSSLGEAGQYAISFGPEA